eukprot:21965-Hanusia_phi.AAC.2
MNYKSGWKTLVRNLPALEISYLTPTRQVLFFNGHGIEGFPYHLCPVTKRFVHVDGSSTLPLLSSGLVQHP